MGVSKVPYYANLALHPFIACLYPANDPTGNDTRRSSCTSFSGSLFHKLNYRLYGSVRKGFVMSQRAITHFPGRWRLTPLTRCLLFPLVATFFLSSKGVEGQFKQKDANVFHIGCKQRAKYAVFWANVVLLGHRLWWNYVTGGEKPLTDSLKLTAMWNGKCHESKRCLCADGFDGRGAERACSWQHLARIC